jgi:hypothetical protein
MYAMVPGYREMISALDVKPLSDFRVTIDD